MLVVHEARSQRCGRAVPSSGAGGDGGSCKRYLKSFNQPVASVSLHVNAASDVQLSKLYHHLTMHLHAG